MSIEEKILDLVEGKLSPQEEAQLYAQIERDPGLKALLKDYMAIMDAEKEVGKVEHSPHPSMTVKVMDEVERIGRPVVKVRLGRRFTMQLSKTQQFTYGGLATAALVVLCIHLSTSGVDPMSVKENVVRQHETNKRPVIANEEKPKSEEKRDKTASSDQKEKSSIADIVRRVRQRNIESQKAFDKEIKEKGGLLSRMEKTGKKMTGPVVAGEAGGKDSGLVRFGDLDDRSAVSKSSVAPPAPLVEAEVDSLSIDPALGSSARRSTGRINTEGMSYNITTSDQQRVVGDEASPTSVTLRKEKALPGKAFAPDLRQDNQAPNTAYRVTRPDRWRPAPPQNREQYHEYEENPRIDVAIEAVSTFSIDVDTGSYTNARRFLRGGTLPPAASVRIEEFINYFDYDYPVQTEKPFTVSYEIAPSPLETDRYLLKLGVKARDYMDERKPWNLVFLVDVSGSMRAQNKLPLVQSSLKLVLDAMEDDDRIAIVTYASGARVVLDSTPATEKDRIKNAINNLRAGGGTHGSAGIRMAYDIAQAHKIKGGVNRVILATDGDFNVGTTSHGALINMIENERKGGVTLTTLGYGTGNIREATMEQLANKGNGNYFYIDSFKEARRVLQDKLASTVEVVAKDVKLQIEFNPAHVSHYRLIGYENRKLRNQDFNNDKVDAGEIGSGHTVTAMYEIILAGTKLAEDVDNGSRYQKPKKKVAETSDAHANELAFLKVRFKQPEGTKSELLRFPIEKGHLKGKVSDTSDDFKFAAAVSYFAHILRRSQFVGNYSVTDVLELASNAKGKDQNGQRTEFLELVRNAKALQP